MGPMRTPGRLLPAGWSWTRFLFILGSLFVAWFFWNVGFLVFATRDICLTANLSIRKETSSRVILVTVDAEELRQQRVSQTQFVDRHLYARAVERLTGYGAAVIVFQVLFDQPSPRARDADTAFAAAVRRSGRVVLATCMQEGQAPATGTLSAPIPELARSAAGLGYSNIPVDPGGLVWSIRLVTQFNDKFLRHLAMESVLTYLRARELKLTYPEGLLVGPARPGDVPVRIPSWPHLRTAAGRTILNFSASASVPRVGLSELLRRNDQADLFKGRIVVIGASNFPDRERQTCFISHLSDLQLTQDDPWLTGVVVDNVLSQRCLVELTRSTRGVALIVFVFLAWLFWGQTLFRSMALVVVASAISWGGALYLYRYDYLLNAFGLTFCIGVVAIGQWTGHVISELARYTRLTRDLSREVTNIRAQMGVGGETGDTVPACDGPGPGQKTGRRSVHLDQAFISRYIPARYTELSPLGKGGMGVVFSALDTQSGYRVALKVISPMGWDRADLISRFLAEARTLQKLSHPGLVRVCDVQKGQLPFFAMELVEGQSLEELVEKDGGWSVPEVLGLACQIADILAYVHSHNVVHRDIKPSNVMVMSDGSTKLLDFGLAHDDARTAITQTGDVMGTFLYSAPEQLKGGRCTPAVDIYSLAVVVCELLTGLQAERVHTVHQLSREALVERSVPDRLIDLLFRCVSEAVADRPSDGRALLDELNSI